MTLPSNSQIVGPAGEALQEASQGAYRQVHERACDLYDEASDCIRKNPVAVVAGALALGVAVGCLIMMGRDSEADSNPLTDASDAICDSARGVFDHLKFW